MARFTFSAGNARVLARAPLYAAGAVLSRFVPRSPNRWVYGSGIGLGEGALALYDAAAARDGDTRSHVWLASTAAERDAARARGMTSERKTGPRGLWLTLRAGVAVVTHGAGDVNRFGVTGTRLIQLWHGIPLKRLHLDTTAALRLPLVGSLPGAQRLMAALYRRAGGGIALFPVASAAVGARIRSAFGLPADRVVALGEPRDDVLLAGDATSRRRDARARIEAAVGPLANGPVVLYAPTWRDGDPDPAVPTADEWTAIAEWCARTGATLLIRSHPLGVGSYEAGTRIAGGRVRLIGRELVADATPLLPGLDLVITDYSSIAFDAAIAGVPSVFFAPDVPTYLARRGLYVPYAEFTGGAHVTTWDAALERAAAALDARSDVAREVAAHAAWLRDEHVDHTDGRATERVLAAIDALLSGTPVTAPAPTTPPALTIDRITLTDTELTLSGTSETPLARLELVGPRQVLGARLTQDGSAIHAEIPLIGERWGHGGLAPVSGSYRLRVTPADEARPTGRARVVAGRVPSIESPLMRADVSADAGGLVVTIAAPLADDERGRAAQRRLEAAYRRATPQPENAVMFESFYAQSAACNPLALDRAIAERLPDVTRYWSVVDRSVAVPDGAIPVVEGSREWWRVRGEARLVIVNDWMRKRWKPRRYQSVLQTWHGTMLKRLALDRDGVGLRTRIAVRRESRRWSVLLAQNEYAADIFRRAYAFGGPIWVEGYPRDDVLVTGDRAAVRERLGLAAHQRAVLYAPTWRDDAQDLVDYLDLPSVAPALTAQTGTEHVVLVRGHSRTLRGGADRRAAGLIDVTSYPDFSDLLLAADAIVTDYSSIMFDAVTTDAPLVLFTPDLERYREQLRGFYFDVTADFPGPVVADRASLIAELARAADDAHPDATAFERRRAEWRARFAPLDDGAASARVVERLIDSGMLG